MSTVIFDIGATKMRFALSEDGVSFGVPIRRSTPEKFDDAWKEIASVIATFAEQSTIERIVGGVRGVLSSDHTRIAHDTLLLNWVGKPLAYLLSETFNVPVHLENDTALAGLAEAVQGAGKQGTIVAYHTVSTGVGGVRIVDRKIDIAHIGFEPGKQILDIDGSILHDGLTHTLEHLIGGSAIATRQHVAPYDIAQSDSIWEESAQYLAHGLYNTVMYWAPDVIVLGGPMIVGTPAIPFDRIIQHTKALLGDLECPPIVLSLLGDDAGMIGALDYARRSAKPTV